MTPPEAVRAQLLLEHWRDVTPEEINRGRCEEFAEELVDTLVIAGHVRAFVVDSDDHTRFMDHWHVWTYVDGKHYDSEAPDGVDDWADLPFFARVVEEVGGFDRRKTKWADADAFRVTALMWETMREKIRQMREPA